MNRKIVKILEINYGFVEVPNDTNADSLDDAVQCELDLGNYYIDSGYKFCEETEKQKIISVLEDLLKEFKEEN